jgi:hypothetical protein
MSKQLLNWHSTKQTISEVWSQYLERHVLRLLLLHDQQLFRGQFRTFFTGSSLPKIPLLQFYDDYLKLIMFSDELLDDILLRIRRQLSLQTNQVSLQEEAPTRGEIDWQRTITRTINEVPDQPPLRFDTLQRQQHTSVPENLLFVALLLHLRSIVQQTLKKDQHDELLTDQERQQLVGIDERIERELAAPNTHALIGEASRSDIDMLVEQVSTRLRPGVSPYRDLLMWWEHFHSLHIGQTSDRRRLTLTNSRRNEQMEIWLYELWIALEILTWLQEKRLINPDTMEIQNDQLLCTFTWNHRPYRFHYCRQLSPATGTMSGWEQVPAIQPSYVIERQEPTEIKYGDTIIWREPPFVMVGAYATDGNASTSLGDSIQKILGSMQLYNAHSGALFSPLLPEPASDKQFTSEVKRDRKVYTDKAAKDTNIHLYKITPDLPNSQLQERLAAVIQQAVNCLPEREKPACHGVMLDSDSVNANQDALQTYNVLCPKPHIGKGVFDLVNRDKHCLKDPHFCHVIGQAILPPRVTRTLNLNDLKEHISELRIYGEEALQQAYQVNDEEETEQLRNEILSSVGKMIEQYVQTRGNTTSQEKFYRDGLFGEYWSKHPRCLAEETRNILLSGEYVWDEYQATELKDWAAPAIQYCRALERELKRRLYSLDPSAYTIKDHKWTLGTLIYLYKNQANHKDQKNWQTLISFAAKSGITATEVEKLIKRLDDEHIADYRNDLAHGKPISMQKALTIKDAIIGRKGYQGVLCYLAEKLNAKMQE